VRSVLPADHEPPKSMKKSAFSAGLSKPCPLSWGSSRPMGWSSLALLVFCSSLRLLTLRQIASGLLSAVQLVRRWLWWSH